jgi:hypothetical protein
MPSGTILNLVPLMLGLLAMQPGTIQQSVTRLVDQDEVILRVPVQPRPFRPAVRWEERKGPKCIATGAIRRALMFGSEHVDFILANRHRVRAELDEDCQALDFYGSIYLQPEDDRLCAGRDAIHLRAGGSCMIERFKLLVPQVRDAQH